MALRRHGQQGGEHNAREPGVGLGIHCLRPPRANSTLNPQITTVRLAAQQLGQSARAQPLRSHSVGELTQERS